MGFHRPLTVLAATAGAGVATALAVSANAGADAIDDAWPYGDLSQPPNIASELPGFVDGGSGTDTGRDNFGPITHIYGDYNVTHTNGGTDDWYSEHYNWFVVPSFYHDESETVTALLDDSTSYPGVGTVWDQSVLFPIYNPAFGTINLFQNTSVNDPTLGYADQFTTPGFSNAFLFDEAGMKDVVSGFGQSYTLFTVPFAASGSGDETDLDGGFAQLLAELGTTT